ncbi:hypothetical protein LIER_16267 [Lithospermum erythrorhizon]|uniref:Uncharacterized protein n=1 Tax=Lithospermum erythrorhizon TaxID=34254 RepID=A0AAV3Q8K3_LITER
MTSTFSHSNLTSQKQRSLIEHDPFPTSNEINLPNDVIRVRFYEDWIRMKNSLRTNRRESGDSWELLSGKHSQQSWL